MAAEPTDVSTAPAPPLSALAARDVRGMYPALRDDHVRYLQKWGFITPATRGGATQFSFQDVSLLRQINGELQRGIPFRRALRDHAGVERRDVDAAHATYGRAAGGLAGRT